MINFSSLFNGFLLLFLFIDLLLLFANLSSPPLYSRIFFSSLLIDYLLLFVFSSLLYKIYICTLFLNFYALHNSILCLFNAPDLFFLLVLTSNLLSACIWYSNSVPSGLCVIPIFKAEFTLQPR